MENFSSTVSCSESFTAPSSSSSSSSSSSLSSSSISQIAPSLCLGCYGSSPNRPPACQPFSGYHPIYASFDSPPLPYLVDIRRNQNSSQMVIMQPLGMAFPTKEAFLAQNKDPEEKYATWIRSQTRWFSTYEITGMTLKRVSPVGMLSFVCSRCHKETQTSRFIEYCPLKRCDQMLCRLCHDLKIPHKCGNDHRPAVPLTPTIPVPIEIETKYPTAAAFEEAALVLPPRFSYAELRRLKALITTRNQRLIISGFFCEICNRKYCIDDRLLPETRGCCMGGVYPPLMGKCKNCTKISCVTCLQCLPKICLVTNQIGFVLLCKPCVQEGIGSNLIAGKGKRKKRNTK